LLGKKKSIYIFASLWDKELIEEQERQDSGFEKKGKRGKGLYGKI
jgi:hypothetical protein